MLPLPLYEFKNWKVLVNWSLKITRSAGEVFYSARLVWTLQLIRLKLLALFHLKTSFPERPGHSRVFCFLVGPVSVFHCRSFFRQVFSSKEPVVSIGFSFRTVDGLPARRNWSTRFLSVLFELVLTTELLK